MGGDPLFADLSCAVFQAARKKRVADTRTPKLTVATGESGGQRDYRTSVAQSPATNGQVYEGTGGVGRSCGLGSDWFPGAVPETSGRSRRCQSAWGTSLFCGPKPQLCGNLQAHFPDERRDLSQTRGGHADCRTGHTEAGIDSTGVIPDGSGDAANMQFMLLEVAGKAISPRSLQFRMQFLKIAGGIHRKAFQLQLFKDDFALGFRQVGKENFPNSGAIERNARSDTRVNAEGLRGVKLFDVNSGEAVAHGQMHRFPGTMIQLLKMRQAGPSNVELPTRSLAQRDACGSQVVDAGAIAAEKARRFQIDEKSMHGADGQTGKPRDMGGRQTSIFQSKKAQQTKSALKRCNGVSAITRSRHVALPRFAGTGQ
jgi:hypothetical protein